MEDFQKILPVTKVKRNLLDILKQMGKEGRDDRPYQKW